MIPDIEAMVSTFLRDDADVADLVGTAVYTALPEGFTGPGVRITRFGGTPVVASLPHLDTAVLQVDAFGGPRATARLLADTCRQALAGMRGTHPTGVVTGVTFGEMANVPDDSYDPARPRYLFTVTVRAHPLPTTGS